MEPERWRAAIGPRADRYLKRFEKIERAGGGWVPGWNVAACLHSTGWFWYRRMYDWAWVNFFAPVLMLVPLVPVSIWMGPEVNLATAAAIIATGYLATVFVLLPMYADSIYFRHLKKRERKDPAALRPSAWTALGAFGIALVPFVPVLVMVQEYEYRANREKVAEGVSIVATLQSPIAAFYETHKRLPDQREAAQFRHSSPMKFTASVGWDAARKAIVATLGEHFNGKRFEIAAQEKDGALVWTCRTIDLEPKYLSGACRYNPASAIE